MSALPGINIPEPHRENMTDPWLSEDNPFNFTATGYLGVKRPPMLSNHLLQKSRVGVAKPKRLAVPRDTAFGGCYRSPWTVAHALNGWSGNLLYSTERKKREKKRIADFLQLNRGAVTGAMTTADDVHLFRRLKLPIKSLYSTKGAEKPVAKVFKPGDVFGKPNIPTSNIVDLVSGGYEKDWLRHAKPSVFHKEKRIDFKRIRPNRASMLRPKIIHTGIHRPPWRSPFVLRKALPRISSFRSRKALDDACSAQSMEASGREGELGQGIQLSMPHEHWPPPLPGQCPP